MIYHLLNVDEDEAKASLDEHGDITTCSFNSCDEPSVIMVLMRKKGGGRGDIESMGACEAHRSPAESALAEGDRRYAEATPMKRFDIWAEGYVASGNRAGAQHMGVGHGQTFADACADLAERTRFGDHYSPAKGTHWGCKLFDNETDARRSFG